MESKRLVKVAEDAACFVCGQKNPIGLKACFNVDKDALSSYAKLSLSTHYQGWQDVVHGGILATLLDEACVYACRACAEQCVTAELQVRYRKPVPVDATVEVFGRVADNSRKVWKAEAQIRIDGALYAEAQAKIFILEK